MDVDDPEDELPLAIYTCHVISYHRAAIGFINNDAKTGSEKTGSQEVSVTP